MVKPLQVSAPVKLTHAEAIEAVSKPLVRVGDLIVVTGAWRSEYIQFCSDDIDRGGRIQDEPAAGFDIFYDQNSQMEIRLYKEGAFRSCLAPSLEQRTGSFEQASTRLYLDGVYEGGGWFESCAHMDGAELSFEFHGAQGIGDNTLQNDAMANLSHTDRESVHLQIARADALKSVYPILKKGTPFAQAQRGRRTGSANLERQAKLEYVESLFIDLEYPNEKSVRTADEKGQALLLNVGASTLRKLINEVRENIRLRSENNTT